MTDTVFDKARKRMKARRSQALGRDAEFVVRARLLLKGLSLVERIHTPWRITRGPGGKILSATPEEKVSGDWRAVGAGGRSVLAECKYRAEGTRLVFSDLERHQVTALNAHAAAGGLSLLVWIHPLGVHVLQWPIDGFGRGESLDVAQAAGLEWKP